MVIYLHINMHLLITWVTAHWIWIGLIVLYICNLLLGHRSQLDSWVLKHPKVGGFLKIVRGALPADPWLILQGLSLLLRGSLPAKLTPVVNIISNDNAAAAPPAPANPPGPTA